MADASNPAIQQCPACGSLIDVTDEQPLVLRHCPSCGEAMRVRRFFNHFELQEVLGAGGVGAVYRALDLNLNRPVALKLLRSEHSQNPELIASFAAEAALTASINHPHVVKVYSTGTDHGVFYIAMELVDKGSLDDLMGLQGKIAEGQLLEVGMQIAEGLNAAFHRGLIHRDIKPGNILFADAHNAKMVDFGLAILQEHAVNTTGEVWGTPYYVAPEKLDVPAREDFRSDIYSLGATLFHAAAGRPPFEADTASMVTLKHLKSQIVSLQSFAPEMSSSTTYVVNKMLSKDPDGRFPSYEDLIEHLKYAQAKFQETKRLPERHHPASKWGSGLMKVAAVAIVATLALVATQYRQRLFAPRPTPAIAASAPQISKPDVNAIYRQACDLLAAGHYSEAANDLRALEAQNLAPQPLQNWISLNAALAFALAGNHADLQKELQQVSGRGAYSSDPTETKLAGFFLRTATLGASAASQPAAAAAQFDLNSHEVFTVLLLAAKDWSLGELDDAGTLFEQFVVTSPEGAAAWIARYKPVAANFVADFHSYQEMGKQARNATGIESLQRSLDACKTAGGQLKTAGRMPEKMAALEADLTHRLQAAQEAKAASDAAQDAADAKALAALLPRMSAFFVAFRFAEGRDAIAAASVVSDKRKAERDAWIKRAEWLASFKTHLIDDINVTGYTQPLARRNGSSIPTGLRKASDTQAEMPTPYGNVPVPWSDLSIESVAAMAQTFLRNAPPETSADRRWQLGVFLSVFGKKAEATPHLQQAAAAKPDYQPQLALFEEPPAAQ